MPVSTKGKGSKNNISKTLSPGNRKCKINSVTLEKDKFSEGVYISLQVEGEKLDNFEGFFKDPNDQSKGRYDGQVGKIQSGLFPFKPNDYKGVTQTITDQVLDFFMKLADESKTRAGLDAIVVEEEGKDEITILEEYVQKASDVLSKGGYVNLLIGGKEYTNKQNYSAYILFIAKPNKGEVSIEGAGTPTADSRLTKYDATNQNHLRSKKKAAPVDSFDGGISGGDELAI